MENEDVPMWVPEPVRRAAAVYGAGHPLMERLLSDPAMEQVWKYLRALTVKEDFRSRFEDGTGNKGLDLHGVDLHWHDAPRGDQALVFLFYAMLLAVNSTRETPDQKAIDREVDRLREAQRTVDGLRHWEPWPTLEVEPHIDRAIKDIVALCDKRISMLDYSKNPGVVEVKGPESTMKSVVRAIGAATHALYGMCCYGQLATMANVMFTPADQIGFGKVEKWCTRPPLPLMNSQIGRGPKNLH